MKVIVQNKKGLNKDVKVFIDKKTMSSYMDKKYEEIKTSVNLKGFRPGKVPKEILKRQFGKAVFNEVLDKVLKDSSTKALDKESMGMVFLIFLNLLEGLDPTMFFTEPNFFKNLFWSSKLITSFFNLSYSESGIKGESSL